jgi:hypothetical protein
MKRALTLCLVTGAFACGGTDPTTPPGAPPPPPPPASGADAGTGSDPDSGVGEPVNPTVVSGGDVSGEWCGAIQLDGTANVPAGQTLSICPGTTISVKGAIPPVRLTVQGSLQINGSESSRVRFTNSGGWDGIKVSGTLQGAGLEISGATLCLDGQSGSTIDLEYVEISGCQRTMQLSNGGSFRHANVHGSSTVVIAGGMLRMSDSVIDVGRALSGPDCTSVNGGGLELDHVQFTNCHCPLHINRTTDQVTITNSIFDGASVPVMIANSDALFSGNNFISSGPEFMDIGGGITANIAGNFWGGDAPRISTSNRSQFTGTGDYAASPIPGAGPR